MQALFDFWGQPGKAALDWQQGASANLASFGKLTMPVLNVFAKDDHIIPPATTRALGPMLPEGQYEELALPGGHVGVFVGGKSQKLFAPAVAQFVGRHDSAVT